MQACSRPPKGAGMPAGAPAGVGRAVEVFLDRVADQPELAPCASGCLTGIRPAASAWSSNEEERRKALLSYFMYGVPYILWDNIPRGLAISCPHIERSCTAAFYADRKLGVSEMVATAAATIHLFTGNNITPRGDLTSRSLNIAQQNNGMRRGWERDRINLRALGDLPFAAASDPNLLARRSISFHLQKV